MSEKNFIIKNIKKNSNSLEVIWDDGKKSKFNYMWLRDNCPTAHDKDSRHRMFNILKVSNQINPKKYSINSSGKLEIEWSEGNHISYYDSLMIKLVYNKIGVQRHSLIAATLLGGKFQFKLLEHINFIEKLIFCCD